MNKTKQKNIISDIQTILLQNWDPVGIGDNPKLKDEYDGYIGLIIETLLKTPSIEEIITLLREIEKDMGTCSETKLLYDIAIRLKNIESCLS